MGHPSRSPVPSGSRWWNSITNQCLGNIFPSRCRRYIDLDALGSWWLSRSIRLLWCFFWVSYGSCPDWNTPPHRFCCWTPKPSQNTLLPIRAGCWLMMAAWTSPDHRAATVCTCPGSCRIISCSCRRLSISPIGSPSTPCRSFSASVRTILAGGKCDSSGGSGRMRIWIWLVWII